jgi:hypothetical protein
MPILVMSIGILFEKETVMTWPNNDFKNFDVTNAFIADNVLVLIES